MAGAFRTLPPALSLTILDPKLTFSEAETQRGVQVWRCLGLGSRLQDMGRFEIMFENVSKLLV